MSDLMISRSTAVSVGAGVLLAYSALASGTSMTLKVNVLVPMSHSSSDYVPLGQLRGRGGSNVLTDPTRARSDQGDDALTDSDEAVSALLQAAAADERPWVYDATAWFNSEDAVLGLESAQLELLAREDA